MDAIVDRSRMVNGVPTSLADLGYTDVGLDGECCCSLCCALLGPALTPPPLPPRPLPRPADNWQQCGTYGPNNYTYHDANGNPMINTGKFPSFKAMTDYAHARNLTAGWYGNNCICSDHCTDQSCYEGDVNAFVAGGFDSYKLDGCGKEYDLSLWYSLLQAAGKKAVIENCE